MATATSSPPPRHPIRRGRAALAVIALLAAVIAAVILSTLAFARPGRPAGPAFPRLRPAAAPSSWRHLRLPNGTAVLSYPPGLRPLAGDKDAVSAAKTGPGGAFQLYLNATPRQGSERPAHWAAFRLHLLRSDDAASAQQVAAAQGIKFRGGTGSCVMDRYTTRIGGHHFQEIACLVHGHASASVIVAAAPTAQWPAAQPVLTRAVAAYRIR